MDRRPGQQEGARARDFSSQTRTSNGISKIAQAGIYISTYLSISISIHVYMYIYIYICVYIYIYIETSSAKHVEAMEYHELLKQALIYVCVYIYVDLCRFI